MGLIPLRVETISNIDGADDMALIIGVAEGGDFFVGDTRVVVSDIEDDLHYKCTVMEKDGESKTYQISDEEATEIIPTVMVSAGKRGKVDLARIAISAPRQLRILRGNLYREEQVCKT